MSLRAFLFIARLRKAKFHCSLAVLACRRLWTGERKEAI